MKNINKKYFLIYILLGIFIFDKFFLLPFIKFFFIQISNRDFFTQVSDNEFHFEEKIKMAIKENKKIVFNFGSSTSYGFYLKNSSTSLKLEKNDIEEVNKFEIFNFSYAGATVLTHAVRIEQILDRGYKPDLILMELAPNSFNSSLSFSEAEITESLTLKFILQNYDWIPINHIKENFFYRIFVLLKFKLGFNERKKNKMLDYYNRIMANNTVEQKNPNSFKVGEENLQFILTNQFILNDFKASFLKYKPSEELKLYFYKILEITKIKKVKILFWHPMVHPIIHEIKKETSIDFEWEKFLNEVNLSNYIDLNKDKNFCDKFIDPLHFAFECYINFFPKILKELR